MDNEKDYEIKEFLAKDKVIPDKINNTFNNFIEKVKNDEIELEKEKIVQFEENKSKRSRIYKFKKLMTVAASLLIVIVASNVYARTQGYDNIFFMIVDLTSPKEDTVEEDTGKGVFSDRDIIISYKSFQVTDSVEMQINELQIKENKAKLYLLIKELAQNSDTPFSYKVYNDKNQKMYDAKSSKKEAQNRYTEVLELSNYSDDVKELKLEIYSQNENLLKTVIINLEEKTIEARTENKAIQKISQIELNKFLKQETEKIYSTKVLQDKQIIILETYDIYYNNGKYIAKYLFMMPTEEDFENDKVEESDIYLNTIEFTVNSNEYKTIKIDKPEIW